MIKRMTIAVAALFLIAAFPSVASAPACPVLAALPVAALPHPEPPALEWRLDDARIAAAIDAQSGPKSRWGDLSKTTKAWFIVGGVVVGLIVVAALGLNSGMSIPPFNAYLGTEIVRRDADEAEVALELAAHHLNRRGVAHGGVITALLDSALGAAVISAIPAEWWVATTSLSTQFLDGAGPGRLTATGRVLRRGRRVAFAAGEVRDARGRLIATAHGTWHLWSRKPGDAGAPVRGRVVLRATGESLRVGKVVAVGRNYAEHAAEMGTPAGRPPVFFLKPASAVVCGGDTIHIPVDAGAVHHEVELAVVIGTPGRAIPVERALDHVLGYAVGLDLTLRDLQDEAKAHREPWSLAKGFDDSAPLSWVVGKDEVGDGSGLAISLLVNGQLRQQGNTSQMLHGVAELIARVSRFMTLERGDVLLTGTPAGVGPLVPGDRLEARIDKVGSLVLAVEISA